MPKIRIKNFGPIKEGFKGEDGNEWIDIKKVTVFIGNQGSGKSTVAKAISTMTWIEKALVRGDFEMPQSVGDIRKHFDFLNLSNYFQDSDPLNMDENNPFSEWTLIEYQGEAYNIACRTDRTGRVLTTKANGSGYMLPKIVYIPAERNFLSVVKNAFNVTGLPDALFAFAEELKRAQFTYREAILPLPIEGYLYHYNEHSDQSYVTQNGRTINLLEASSGFQSMIPLYLVSRNLARLERGNRNYGRHDMNVNQSIRMNDEIAALMLNDDIDDDQKLQNVAFIKSKFQNKAFINIVEEPEQNLFPSSQWEILKSLLEFNSSGLSNKLVMTTHSPYLINYISIAIQGDYLKNKLQSSSNAQVLLTRLNNIISLDATVPATDVAIYQLDERDGSIRLLPTYEGIPSDKNYLNQSLQHGNEMFDMLLEIEEEA